MLSALYLAMVLTNWETVSSLTGEAVDKNSYVFNSFLIFILKIVVYFFFFIKIIVYHELLKYLKAIYESFTL